MNDHARAMRRIRKAITNAMNWHETDAFKGGGDPDHYEYIEYKAKQAKATLDRVILEELERARLSTRL